MMQHGLEPARVRAVAVLAAMLWILAIAVNSSFGQAAPAQQSTNDGVYSVAQAERGQKVFKASCEACHELSRFTGDEFLKSWAGQPLLTLYELVKATMPEDSPGSLKPQQYADVIAYFLELNKFPAGPDELKADAAAMKAVKLDKKGR